MSVAAVRVRGGIRVRGDIADTLGMLRLNRPNHCVVLPPRDTYMGMLVKAKDYITWGEVDGEVLAQLLAARGRRVGGTPLTETHVRELGYDSIAALAEAVLQGEADLQRLDDVKPVFRLSPPRKGYGGVKRSFREGGALGDRGPAINELLLRMMG
ncbi:MAG: 50S ribosomal protein L30 [Candidatus Thermoplasmatota archaeon]|nr:50S ribosomal protein L30 [Candidatus Thermoplasmatota archaeon]